MKYFKLMIATLALSNASWAADDLDRKGAKPQMGPVVDYNWTQTFQTKVGPITHTPQGVQFMGMRTGGKLSFGPTNLNGVSCPNGLKLDTVSTKEQFIAALKAAGIWKD